MAIHNLMSSSGFADGVSLGGDWFLAWVYVGLLGIFCFLGYMVLKKNYDYDFNLAGGLAGVLTCIVIITLTGWSKVGFIVGLVVLFIGGFFADRFIGGGG